MRSTSMPVSGSPIQVPGNPTTVESVGSGSVQDLMNAARRLIFLKHPDVVRVVQALDDHATVAVGTVLTATATLGGNTSEFSGNVTVAAAPPDVSLVKSCPLPANCTTDPQQPGTELTYQIDFVNNGGSVYASDWAYDVVDALIVGYYEGDKLMFASKVRNQGCSHAFQCRQFRFYTLAHCVTKRFHYAVAHKNTEESTYQSRCNMCTDFCN